MPAKTRPLEASTRKSEAAGLQVLLQRRVLANDRALVRPRGGSALVLRGGHGT